MALLPPDMDANCNRKQRCLFGSNAGLAYDPSNACPPDKTFNELLCDCEDYFECDCSCHDNCPECQLCVNGTCEVDPACDAYKTYFAVYRRYLSSSGCVETGGPPDRASFRNLISGGVSGTTYITYTFEFVRDEPLSGGRFRTVWQPVATYTDASTGESTVTRGQTITTSGDPPSVVSIIGDQVECFQQEPACLEDPVLTECYNSRQQKV